MPANIVNIDNLCAELRALAPGSIAALEGFCGSGKTTLADQLAKLVPMDVCHVDNFARKFDQPPPYAECLNIGQLHRALEQREQTRPIVVEGICLRDVLTLVDVSASIFVYLKRIGINGLWYDELHLEEFEREEPVPGNLIEPHRSDFDYHARVRPHEKADLVFERVEDD